jgi:protein-disulfide isomerase
MEKSSLVGILVGGVVLGAVVGAGATKALTKKGTEPGMPESTTCSSTGGPASADQPLFSLNGKTYTQGMLPLEIQGQITRAQNQAYNELGNVLKEYAVRVFLAKEKNLDVNNPPPLNEMLGSAEVSEDEISKIVEMQKANIPKGMPMEEVRKQIKMALGQRKSGEAIGQKFAQLEQSGDFKMLLTAPEGKPIQTDGFPQKGNKDAAVKVAIVTDYLCGHCRHRAEEYEAAMTDFSDRVQFTRIIMSLNPEGLSGELAKGAFCAYKANPELFWKYHTLGEKVPFEAARPSQMSTDPKKQFRDTALGVAKDAGFDVAEFGKCLESKEAEASVRSSGEMLSAAGVDGTPTIFLNGKKVVVAPGKLPDAIKDALAKAGK